jgi:preprotein translocase subunit YajC
MKKWMWALVAVVVLAAVGGGAFYAGMQVGKNQAQQQMAQFARQRFAAMQQGGQVPGTPGAPQGARAFGAGGGLAGTVKAIQGDSLVLATDQGDVQVRVTESTLIRKTMNVTLKDLEEGEQVVVSGTRAEDGTVTARAIQSVQFLGPRPEATAQP